MNAYEMAIAYVNDPVAFQAEIKRRSLDHCKRLAASAARVYGLSAEQEQKYFDAIKDLPASIPSKSGKTMKPVPVHDIGMMAAGVNAGLTPEPFLGE